MAPFLALAGAREEGEEAQERGTPSGVVQIGQRGVRKGREVQRQSVALSAANSSSGRRRGFAKWIGIFGSARDQFGSSPKIAIHLGHLLETFFDLFFGIVVVFRLRYSLGDALSP
ncbi:unnamed protein product [Urochloa humidicola]